MTHNKFQKVSDYLIAVQFFNLDNLDEVEDNLDHDISSILAKFFDIMKKLYEPNLTLHGFILLNTES